MHYVIYAISLPYYPKGTHNFNPATIELARSYFSVFQVIVEFCLRLRVDVLCSLLTMRMYKSCIVGAKASCQRQSMSTWEQKLAVRGRACWHKYQTLTPPSSTFTGVLYYIF